MNATGLAQAFANKYLAVLIDLHVITKELPVIEEKPYKSKKGLYRITDEFFQFWFKYIFTRRADLELGNVSNVVGDIHNDWPQNLSLTFEKVIIEILRKSSDRFFPFSAIGRWWEKNEEIDAIALNKDLNAILFAEAKWSEKRVGEDILDALLQKAALIQWGNKGRKEFYCLFSKSRFTPALQKRAANGNIYLFEQDRLLKN